MSNDMNITRSKLAYWQYQEMKREENIVQMLHFKKLTQSDGKKAEKPELSHRDFLVVCILCWNCHRIKFCDDNHNDSYTFI